MGSWSALPIVSRKRAPTEKSGTTSADTLSALEYPDAPADETVLALYLSGTRTSRTGYEFLYQLRCDLALELRASLVATLDQHPYFAMGPTRQLHEAHAYGELITMDLPTVVKMLEGALSYAATTRPEAPLGPRPFTEDVWAPASIFYWRHSPDLHTEIDPPTGVGAERQEPLPRPTDLRAWWRAARPYLPPLSEPDLRVYYRP